MFLERDQKCGYMIEGGGPCINNRITHTHEHCDEKGHRQNGYFDETQQLDSNFLGKISATFVGYYKNLCREGHRVINLPSLEKSGKVRKSTLQKYKAIWKMVRSNKTCFACLQAVPDHMLECGHTFCAQCVQEFGKKSEYIEYGWVVDQCILCQCSWQDHRHIFRQHPRCAGIRALTLDGGGVRGIVELALLEQVQAAIGLDISFRELFDIIVGTSTGKSKLFCQFMPCISPLRLTGVVLELSNINRWDYCSWPGNKRDIDQMSEGRVYFPCDKDIREE
jgi:hypothetical protein